MAKSSFELSIYPHETRIDTVPTNIERMLRTTPVSTENTRSPSRANQPDTIEMNAAIAAMLAQPMNFQYSDGNVGAE
ncbi:MAG: hypothetical protein NVS1B11_36920 [Terriglobales bacterium]